MKDKNRLDTYVHYIMAVCGGCFGGYALFGRMAVFGSAQTANLIELVGDILGKNIQEVFIRIGAVLIYGAAIVLSVVLSKKLSFSLKYPVIFIEISAALFLGFLPENINPIIALYPVFFITAFQWCVFTGARGYVSSTIFSTNNMKQAVISVSEYFLSKDENERRQKADKARFFGGTLLSFHAGVAFEYMAYQALGLFGIIIAVVPLAAGMVLLAAGDEKIKIPLRNIKNVKMLKE